MSRLLDGHATIELEPKRSKRKREKMKENTNCGMCNFETSKPTLCHYEYDNKQREHLWVCPNCADLNQRTLNLQMKGA